MIFASLVLAVVLLLAVILLHPHHKPAGGCLRIDYFYSDAPGDTAYAKSFSYDMHYIHVHGWTFDFVKEGNRHSSREGLETTGGYDRTTNLPLKLDAALTPTIFDKGDYKIVMSHGDSTPSLFSKLKEAVRYLIEDCKVESITSDCGFCMYFQKEICEIVAGRVPVILSSLVLAPLLMSTYIAPSTVLILTASKALTSDKCYDLLQSLDHMNDYKVARHVLKQRVKILAFDSVPYFGKEVATGMAVRYSKARPHFVRHVSNAVGEYRPTVLLLECTEMGMFANDLRSTFSVGVYSSINAMNIVHHSRLKNPLFGA